MPVYDPVIRHSLMLERSNEGGSNDSWTDPGDRLVAAPLRVPGVRRSGESRVGSGRLHGWVGCVPCDAAACACRFYLQEAWRNRFSLRQLCQIAVSPSREFEERTDTATTRVSAAQRAHAA